MKRRRRVVARKLVPLVTAAARRRARGAGCADAGERLDAVARPLRRRGAVAAGFDLRIDLGVAGLEKPHQRRI
jgi:hypothetical protein